LEALGQTDSGPAILVRFRWTNVHSDLREDFQRRLSPTNPKPKQACNGKCEPCIGTIEKSVSLRQYPKGAYVFDMTTDCTITARAARRTRHPLALRLQCRKEWVEGQGTLAEIAQKHGIPEYTLVAWYRRENWTPARNRWLEKQRSDYDAPVKASLVPPAPENSNSDSRVSKLQRLEAQLEALDNLIDNAKSADDWHKLSTAKHRLLENYYVLAGIPKPGSRRPAPERSKSPISDLRDLMISEPVPASG
jgi:transposase-like protein